MLSAGDPEADQGITQLGGRPCGGVGSMLSTVAVKLAVLPRPFQTPSSIHWPETLGFSPMPDGGTLVGGCVTNRWLRRSRSMYQTRRGGSL
jgi:hypothetical protein